MKISISNIAWSPKEEKQMAKFLPSLGIRDVEVAFPRIMPKINSFRNLWEENGVKISSMQALLYQKDELKLFDSAQTRQLMLEYLFEVIEKAEQVGATKLVFGSPKNRNRGRKSLKTVLPIAVDFFRRLGDKAKKHKIIICIPQIG